MEHSRNGEVRRLSAGVELLADIRRDRWVETLNAKAKDFNFSYIPSTVRSPGFCFVLFCFFPPVERIQKLMVGSSGFKS